MPSAAARRLVVRQNPVIDTKDIEKELSRLEEERQRVAHVARKNEAALAALEEQRLEYVGRRRLAEQAEEDIKRRLEEKRVELQHAEAEAAVADYERAVGAREAFAERFAAAAEAAVAALAEYEAAEQRVAEALEGVRSRRAEDRLSKDEGEPAIVAQSLEQLVDVVRKRLDTELEHDLVEAAARSPLGNDIDDLPAHLQVLARKRRSAILKQARARGGATSDGDDLREVKEQPTG